MEILISSICYIIIIIINAFVCWCIVPVLKTNHLIVCLNKGNSGYYVSKWISKVEQSKLKIVNIKNFDKFYSLIKTKNKIYFEEFLCITIAIKINVKIYEYASNQLNDNYFATRKVKFKFTQFHWKVVAITT